MWVKTGIAVILASTTSASYLGLLERANWHCPLVADAIAATSTLSITAPAATVTVTKTLSPAAAYASPATCLSDAQATNIVSSWNAILTHTDRTAANVTAQSLIADEFLRTSDSVNSLTGLASHCGILGVNGVGSAAQEVRGVDLLYLTDDKSQIQMAMTEFNSLAWAKDIGWKIQKADGTTY